MNVMKLVIATDVVKAQVIIRKALTALEDHVANPRMSDAQRIEIVTKVLELRRSLCLDRAPRAFGRAAAE